MCAELHVGYFFRTWRLLIWFVRCFSSLVNQKLRNRRRWLNRFPRRTPSEDPPSTITFSKILTYRLVCAPSFISMCSRTYLGPDYLFRVLRVVQAASIVAICAKGCLSRCSQKITLLAEQQRPMRYRSISYNRFLVNAAVSVSFAFVYMISPKVESSATRLRSLSCVLVFSLIKEYGSRMRGEISARSNCRDLETGVRLSSSIFDVKKCALC